MSPPPDIDAFSPPELKSLVLELLAEREEPRRTIGTLRDEITQLKGDPGRPDIEPSGMEQTSEARSADRAGGPRRRV